MKIQLRIEQEINPPNYNECSGYDREEKCKFLNSSDSVCTFLDEDLESDQYTIYRSQKCKDLEAKNDIL